MSSQSKEEDKGDQVLDLFNDNEDSVSSDDEVLQKRKKNQQVKKPVKKVKQITQQIKKEKIKKESESEEDSYDDSEDDYSQIQQRKKSQRRNQQDQYRDFLDELAMEDEDDGHQREDERLEDQKQIELYQNYRRTDPLDRYQNIEDLDFKEKEQAYRNEYMEELQNQKRHKKREPFLKPTLSDPRLYMVKCKIGREQDTAIGIMKKYFDLKKTDKKFTIFSALAIGKMQGHIFVEAFNKEHVLKAVEGFVAITNPYIKLIPLDEVQDVMSPDPNKEFDFKKGQFVKVKSSGLYHHDLGVIHDINIDTQKVYVRLIPRLGVGKKDQSNNLRPPQKLFQPEEFPAEMIQRDRYEGLLMKGQYFLKGFLIKKLNFTSVETDNINPSVEEVEMFSRFENKNQNLILQNLVKQQKKDNYFSYLRRGDLVKILFGTEADRVGKIIDIDQSKKIIRVIMMERLRQSDNYVETNEIKDFESDQIKKMFKEGDAVEIISGANEGICGVVIAIENNKAHVKRDDGHGELIVFVNNLVSKQKNYHKKSLKNEKKTLEPKKLDLVSLNNENTVGVIIEINKDTVTILDMSGFKQTINKIQIKQVIKKHLSVQNKFQQEILPKYTVKVLGGPHKDNIVSVIHVYKRSIFLKDKHYKKNEGIYVTTADNCYVLDTQQTSNVSYQARFNSHIQRTNEQQREVPLRKTTMQQKMVQLVGQRRKILRGKYKGFEGVIRSLTDTQIKFELSAQNKVVSIPYSDLNIQIEEKEQTHPTLVNTHRTSAYNQFQSPGRNYQTPMHNPDRF